MKISSPRFSAVPHPTDSAALGPEVTLEGLHLISPELVGANLKGMSFDECIIEKALALQARLEKWQLTDVEVRGGDFSGAQLSDASLIRVHLANGRFSGCDLSQAILKDIVFKDCKLDMANFRFAKLTKVQFIDCTLIETDFQGAQLTQVGFQSCKLERVEFGQSQSAHLDLRGSELVDIRGWQALKGATIDDTQLVMIAPQLAAALGLRLEE